MFSKTPCFPGLNAIIGLNHGVNKAKQLIWRLETQPKPVKSTQRCGQCESCAKKIARFTDDNCSNIMFCAYGPLILMIIDFVDMYILYIIFSFWYFQPDSVRSYKRTCGPLGTSHPVGHSRDSRIAAARIVMDLHVWKTVENSAHPRN